MKIDLTYTVPVTVTVDTAKKVVDRVFLDDKHPLLSSAPIYVHGTTSRAQRQTASRAKKIAEEAPWPEWER